LFSEKRTTINTFIPKKANLKDADMQTEAAIKIKSIKNLVAIIYAKNGSEQ